MRELGSAIPAELATDVGPVIDEAARARLEEHAARMRAEAQLLYALRAAAGDAARQLLRRRSAFEMRRLDQLRTARCSARSCTSCASARRRCDAGARRRSAATGYGLTLGIHSRIDERRAVRPPPRSPVGNTYVNRNMIGAVVGVQPFGGEGLSGTGPKAGGPHYLPRFATERTLTVNTAAIGGNVELLS